MLTKEGQHLSHLFTLLNLLLTAGPYATQENYEFQILQSIKLQRVLLTLSRVSEKQYSKK
ncbi:hypothetical protein CHS0354_024570, partial [Potamilus streckersoni]